MWVTPLPSRSGEPAVHRRQIGGGERREALSAGRHAPSRRAGARGRCAVPVPVAPKMVG
jgi:hypothetical protein